ncbi:MAG TPA: hypothetical protein VL860_01595 [Planctomycetota bacterium]|nr:hypothetical protein [Planctomycetota bacterium]
MRPIAICNWILAVCSMLPLFAAEEPPEIVLPVGAGEAVALPGPVKLWKQVAGPPVAPAELDGTTTWRLFEPGTYRFTVADGATPISAIRSAAWRVYPGKTAALGNRRPVVALPGAIDVQAGHPLMLAALNPRDDDGDGLSYSFRIVNANPPQDPGALMTRETDPRCVLNPAVAGRFDVECRVFDGRMFSHPAVTRVTVGAAPARGGPFEDVYSLEGDDFSMRDAMESLAHKSGATIAFQGAAELKEQHVSFNARNLPLLRILDLAAWQTGAHYRLDLLPGDNAPDKAVILWINGWAELRGEPLVAGELSAAEFAQTPDGSDIEPRLNDIVREALAALPAARINLHGRNADVGVAVYLPRSAYDRLSRALTVLNKPSMPKASLPAAAEARAAALALHFETVDCSLSDAPLNVALATLGNQLHRTLMVNPQEAENWQAAARARAQPSGGHQATRDPTLLSFIAHDEPGDSALARFCETLAALRGSTDRMAPPIEPRAWAAGCLVISSEPPLPEPSGRTPGPGQWLWQSATVQAYDLTGVLAATGGTGEWIEHRVRTQFAREFHDPAAHLSWWPRKKALLVIQRPAVQEAVANLLAGIMQEERSPLHQPVALTTTPPLGK